LNPDNQAFKLGFMRLTHKSLFHSVRVEIEGKKDVPGKFSALQEFL
jgi:hypothetical protein